MLEEHRRREREIQEYAVQRLQNADKEYAETVKLIIKLADDLAAPAKQTLEDAKTMIKQQHEKEWKEERERFQKDADSVNGRIRAMARAERRKKQEEEKKSALMVETIKQ
jgi:hypothetical protein